MKITKYGTFSMLDTHSIEFSDFDIDGEEDNTSPEIIAIFLLEDAICRMKKELESCQQKRNN